MNALQSKDWFINRNNWRSDAVEALKPGGAVAISILRDQKATFNEDFDDFTFTTFGGTHVTI